MLLYFCACPHGGAAARAESHGVRPHGSGPEDAAGGGAAGHGVSVPSVR